MTHGEHLKYCFELGFHTKVCEVSRRQSSTRLFHSHAAAAHMIYADASLFDAETLEMLRLATDAARVIKGTQCSVETKALGLDSEEK